MTRKINNYTIWLIVIFCFTFLMIANDFFSGHRGVPRIFQRTHHSHQIFPTDAQVMDIADLPYMIANDNICANRRHVIVVHSAAGNIGRRNDFRETWANPDVLKPFQTKLVFILGRPRDQSVLSDIFRENGLHQDIVMGNFFDDYKNLTLKAVTGLRWVAENCPHATTVFKIDDDVFVDIFKAMEEIVPLLDLKPRQLICSAEPKAFIFRNGDSEALNKWKVSDSYFPGLGKYPMPFCYGFGVFMSGKVARELFELAKSMPFYRLDDVFMYGVVANKLEGLSWRSEDDLFTQDADFTLSVFREEPCHGGLLLGTVRSRSATLELWELTKQLHKCNNNKSVPPFCSEQN